MWLKTFSCVTLGNLYSLTVESVKKIRQQLTDNYKVKPFNENKVLYLKELQHIFRNKSISHSTPVAPYDVRISAPDLSILPKFDKIHITTNKSIFLVRQFKILISHFQIN